MTSQATAAGERLTSSAVETSEGFAGLESEWDELLERSRSRSVFLAWGWLYPWWGQFGGGRSLKILTVRDERGRLVGLAPFCVERVGRVAPIRVLSFLGTERVSSEYLDVIADPSLERDVARAVWDALRSGSDSWDSIRLTDLLEESTLAAHWTAWAREDGFAVDEERAQVAPYLSLPRSTEEFRLALGPETRANLKRKSRKLERHGAALSVVETPAEVSTALETLFDLHGRRWAARERTGNLAEDRVREFHRQVAGHLGARGMIRLYALRLANHAVACLYGFEYKRRFYYYQAGFDPASPVAGLRGGDYSPGFVLMGHCIEDAISRGLEEFDFLRGPESYKSLWTRSRRETRAVTLSPPGRWNALARHAARRTLRATKRLAKRILKRPA
ncbi:MAG: GNAT family N-acetyltransferase [Candidatus Latescibacteria bacterium]|nr:GNAT family N-acetyltransferase [Candidatus Latescibacterota bacterium]